MSSDGKTNETGSAMRQIWERHPKLRDSVKTNAHRPVEHRLHEEGNEASPPSEQGSDAAKIQSAWTSVESIFVLLTTHSGSPQRALHWKTRMMSPFAGSQSQSKEIVGEAGPAKHAQQVAKHPVDPAVLKIEARSHAAH